MSGYIRLILKGPKDETTKILEDRGFKIFRSSFANDRVETMFKVALDDSKRDEISEWYRHDETNPSPYREVGALLLYSYEGDY